MLVGGGVVGWSSAAFPAACPSSSFRYHHLHPLPFSSCLLPVLQGSKTMSYNSSRRIIPRSWLRDWNPQLPSSSHMALSFFHCGTAYHLKTAPPWHAALASICHTGLVRVWCLSVLLTLCLFSSLSSLSLSQFSLKCPPSISLQSSWGVTFRRV